MWYKVRMTKSRNPGLLAALFLAPLFTALSGFLVFVAWGWLLHIHAGSDPVAMTPARIAHAAVDFVPVVYLCSLAGLLVLGVPARLLLLRLFGSRWVNYAGIVIGAIAGMVVLDAITPSGRGWSPQIIGGMFGGTTGFWWGLLLELRSRARQSRS